MANVATFEPGDVLLFTSDDSHIDRIICLLTDSDVAHSALFYGKDVDGKDILVDAATRCGIAGHQMEVLPPERTAPGGKTSPSWAERDIYVHRLKTPPPFPSELFPAARGYSLENNGFNFTGLIEVGLLLLFRMGPRPGRIMKLLRELLEMLTDELGNLHPMPGTGTGSHPMYCSQFVCQCFSDAKRPLKIDKTGPALAPSTTMLDWIVRGSASFAPVPGRAGQSPRPGKRTVDDVVADLYEALSSGGESRDESIAADSGSPSSELIQATNEFGEALQRVQGTDGSKGILAGLSYLKELQNHSVTPADLRERCSSLVPIEGTYHIRRNADVCPVPKK